MAMVDAHAHVFTAVSERYPRDVHELFPPDLEAPAEAFLAQMDAAGVERAVVVPLSPHDEYVRDCLERHPGRFAAVGIQDPDAADPVDDLHRRVEESGIQGLRVFDLGDPDVDDAEQLDIFPLLAALEEGGYKLWYYGAPDQLPLLDRTLALVPELPVVLNHLGFCQEGFETDEHGRPRVRASVPPPTLPQVLELARYPNVYVMFSGHYAFSSEPYPYRDLVEVSTALYEAFGAERMLWASDFPWIVEEPGYAPLLEMAEHHLPALSPGERRALMGGTADDLFEF